MAAQVSPIAAKEVDDRHSRREAKEDAHDETFEILIHLSTPNQRAMFHRRRKDLDDDVVTDLAKHQKMFFQIFIMSTTDKKTAMHDLELEMEALEETHSKLFKDFFDQKKTYLKLEKSFFKLEDEYLQGIANVQGMPTIEDLKPLAKMRKEKEELKKNAIKEHRDLKKIEDEMDKIEKILDDKWELLNAMEK